MGYLESLKLKSRNKERFIESPQPNFPCICSGQGFAELDSRTHIFFNNWYKENLKIYNKNNKERLSKNIKLIGKLNKPRKGPKYIDNTPGFVIEAKGVTKWFANKVGGQYNKVLHGINLDIKTGEFVVILGYSGSGKSTLLNILSGIERPSNGSIVVSGHNLISLSEKELTIFRKENMSFIFQNYALLSELTVRENIMQGAAIQEDVHKRLDIDELVELVGIKEHLDKHIRQLSGGQQQRVAIVKSVIKNPKILFADEPTAAVDEETAKNILKVFCEINKKYNTTIILITHNPIISKLANRKILIEKGRIIQSVKQVPISVDRLAWTTLEYAI